MSDHPTADDLARWQRRLAAQANNDAWTLAELSTRSAEQNDAMLHAAHAAMHFWTIVGNDDNRVHAALLLAHVYALRNDATQATGYLDRALPALLQPVRAPWETAFAHAVAAGVARARDDTSAQLAHDRAARQAAERMTDAQARRSLDAILRAPDPPAS